MAQDKATFIYSNSQMVIYRNLGSNKLSTLLTKTLTVSGSGSSLDLDVTHNKQYKIGLSCDATNNGLVQTLSATTNDICP